MTRPNAWQPIAPDDGWRLSPAMLALAFGYRLAHAFTPPPPSGAAPVEGET